MDAFITYVPQKKKAHDHTIHGERIALLERYLSMGEKRRRVRTDRRR